jgi:signal transduction histidine kinase
MSKEQVAAEIQQLIVQQVATISRELRVPERFAYGERNQRLRELFALLMGNGGSDSADDLRG